MISLLEQELERRGPSAKIEWPVNEFGWLNKIDGAPYKPNPGGQEAFHASGVRFRALIGSRGSGKTACGVQEALKMIRERPGMPGAMIAPDHPQWLKAAEEFWKWVPEDRVVQHHKTECWVLFDNGAKVWYGGIHDPDSWRGPNLNWVWFDEAARSPERAWLILLATVRVPPDPMVWITTTPRGMRHWVYDFFVKKDWPQEVLDLFGGEVPVEWFHANIEQNKEHVDPGFYASLLTAYTGAFKRQEVGGEFVEEGGTLASRHWFGIVDKAPVEARRVRFWDLAATEKRLAKEDPDYTAGARVALADGCYYIEHMLRDRLSPDGVQRFIRRTAEIDQPKVRIGIEQEPGASGKTLVAHYVRVLTGHHTKGYRPTGDKVARAMPWLGQAEAGNVKLVRGPWNEAFLDEVENFPLGDHDDQVDAVSGAMQMLMKAPGIIFL